MIQVKIIHENLKIGVDIPRTVWYTVIVGGRNPREEKENDMKTTINIKAVGTARGTVGWLREQLETGEMVLEESNDYFYPSWGEDAVSIPPHTPVHGLVIRDKDGKNSAILAYRGEDHYDYCLRGLMEVDYSALSSWYLPLTDAAREALEEICRQWIAAQEERKEEEITITVNRIKP
jgi:hypothetical protein